MFYSLVLCEFLQGLAALVFGASNLGFNISGIKLFAGFTLNSGILITSFILLFPYILTIIVIELSAQIIKKYSHAYKGYFATVFSLVLSGFLLIDVFYSAFSVILRFNYENDLVQLVDHLNLTEGLRIAVVFIIIIFISGYLNLSSKRIIKYINIKQEVL